MPEEQVHNGSAVTSTNSLRIYLSVRPGDRLYQGEVVERVFEWDRGFEIENQAEVIGLKRIYHKLALVLTQDCDLMDDWRERQSNLYVDTNLWSVLLCPAFPAEELRQSQRITSRRWELVRQNKDERYAYLDEIPVELDTIRVGHPAILLDLTKYFTIRTVDLYRQLVSTDENAPRRRCRLETPWREHLQCRFAAYQARIGLPRDHFIPESRRSEPSNQ